MSSRHLLAAFLFVLVLAVPGCSRWGSSDPDIDEEFPEPAAINDSSVPESTPSSQLNAQNSPAAVTDPQIEPAALRTREPSKSALVMPRLKVGERFPLIKRVSQVLTQLVAGRTVLSRSDLVLLMTITVDRVQNDRALLSVRYDRVQYSHNITGQKFEFDSQQGLPPDAPDLVRAYAAMVGNGFSFWLGADNRIVGLVGLEQFLQHCVQPIAPERRAEIFRQLAATEESDWIANFVDDSIGLLARTADQTDAPTVHVGKSWTHQRELLRPIPMVLTTEFTLSALTDYEATFDVVGKITPPTAATSDITSSNGLELSVQGGHIVGHCNIDRRTGLPLYSRTERVLEFVVRLPDGRVLPETKSVISTVQAFPQKSDYAHAASSASVAPVAGSGAVSTSTAASHVESSVEPPPVSGLHDADSL